MVLLKKASFYFANKRHRISLSLQQKVCCSNLKIHECGIDFFYGKTALSLLLSFNLNKALSFYIFSVFWIMVTVEIFKPSEEAVNTNSPSFSEDSRII